MKNGTHKIGSYLKIHIAVNIKTKEILALEEVADEKIHDSSRMLNKLVDEVLKAVPPDEKNIVKKAKISPSR
jgi:hypothetical protein